MAYAKKTTTKKNATKKSTAPKTVAPIEEEVLEEKVVEVEEEKVEEVVKAPVKAKKEFHSDDTILCRSVVVGKLNMIGNNTNIVYRWMNYGDECEVEYRDLVSAVRSHSPHIYKPYFIVEDQDFIDEFRELKKFYSEKFTINELTDILNMNEGEMEDAIAILPDGAKEQFINIVSTSVADGTLDSVRKIKALERILDIDLSLVAEIQS